MIGIIVLQDLIDFNPLGFQLRCSFVIYVTSLP